jgi:putative ABC transport system permease protein
MTLWNRFWSWLRAVLQRTRMESEMDAELRFHIEAFAEDLVRNGVPRTEALRRARLEFGGIEQTKEECRDARGTSFVESLIQDLRFGLRMLRKNPGFTVVAVLTLALGIGVNTAIFSLGNAILLKPLPYPEPSQLVHARWLFPSNDVPSVTAMEFAFWKEHSRVFESAAAVGLFPSGYNLAGSDHAEYVKALKVSCDFFHTLGIQPFLGRGFTAEEDRPNGPKAAILSYGLWQRRFTSDAGVVGHAITLDTESYTVIGVMPKGFEFVLPYARVQDTEAWVPLNLVPDPHDQGHNFTMIARLKSGVSLEQAQSDMARVLAAIRLDAPGHVAPSERGMLLIPYQEWVTGNVRTPLLILFAAVGLVLLIATVNVANLILTRAVTRHSEVAVRLALGASKGRLSQQLLTENLLLAFLGGCIAMAATPWAVHALVALAPRGLPLAGEPQIDLPVLAFTFCLAATAGVATGLVPALGASRFKLSDSIKQGGRTSTGRSGHRRLRNFIVTSEVALSVLLLTGAMLLILSLAALERVDPGFNAQGVWTFHLWLPGQNFKTAATMWDFEQRVLVGLAALAGTESAAVVSALPLEPGLNGDVPVTSGGQRAHVYVEERSASPSYFGTMQIPVLRGRAFRDSDTASAPLVVVVNQAFARMCCVGRDVLGSQVALNAGPKGDLGREVVGVVGDTREEAIAEPAPPMVFFPPAQLDDDLARTAFSGWSWVVRSRAPLAMNEVQQIVARVDPGEAVADLSPMGGLVAESFAPSRFMASLMAVFAGLALLLAAIGLYGVLSYSIAERTHEIGLRMALGAKRRDVLAMVLGQGLRVALVGAGIGLAMALALTRFLLSLLYRVKPTDPATFVAVPLVLAAIALLASYIPARKAATVDPMVALRYE